MASTEQVTTHAVALPEISTGDPATVNDAYDTTKYQNGARMQPGAAFYTKDSSGRIQKYRYVRLNSTAPPTAIVGPVYWKDNTRQVVTAVYSEALHVNAAAGVLLNASATNGNWVCILVYGYVNMVVAASTAAGDALIGASGNQLTARVAAGTAPTNKVLAWAQTAISSTKSDVEVVCELP